jgi:lipoic acid synthetase
VHTKSGLMVGLGETHDELRDVMRDLRGVGCEMLTIGQYLAPSPGHYPVARFLEPAEFDELRDEAKAMGFLAVASGPFVRSSYRAEGLLRDAEAVPGA